MKKYSVEAKELLTTVELHEIKAGERSEPDTITGTCGILCSNCIGCTSCTACTSSMTDIFVAQ